jgi:predicted PurR-regulated permease PerM
MAAFTKPFQMSLVLAAFVALIYCFQGILTPFIIALILAYALNPLVVRMVSWHIPRAAASGLIVLLFVATIGLLIISLAPMIHVEILSFIKRTPELARHLQALTTPTLNQFTELVSPADLEKLKEVISGYFGEVILLVARMITGILGGGFAIANTIALFIITPVVCFYTLKDWDRILASASKLIPPGYRKSILAIVHDIDRTMSGFARGQALVCLMMAAYYSAALSIVRLDFALILGIATGILTCVPYVGVLIGISSALVIAMTQFTTSWEVTQVVLAFAIGIGIEGYVLTPKLVGDRIGLHPIWIIFSVLAGAHLHGLIGVIIALPLASIIGVVIRHGVLRYQKSALFNK